MALTACQPRARATEHLDPAQVKIHLTTHYLPSMTWRPIKGEFWPKNWGGGSLRRKRETGDVWRGGRCFIFQRNSTWNESAWEPDCLIGSKKKPKIPNDLKSYFTLSTSLVGCTVTLMLLRLNHHFLFAETLRVPINLQSNCIWRHICIRAFAPRQIVSRFLM